MRDEIDRRIRRQMRIEFDARERQQVVDQPRHARGLTLHDGEEFFARRRIVLGGALQRLDEAEQGRERRAQFMAGIGDEVGAHLLDPAQRAQVVEGHQQDVGAAIAAGRQPHRRHKGLEPAVDRHPLEELDALRLTPLAGAADGVDQFRHAQGNQRRLATTQRRRQAARRFVEGDDAAVAIKHNGRPGQSADQRLDQRRLRMNARTIDQRQRAADPQVGTGIAEQHPQRAAQAARPTVSAVLVYRHLSAGVGSLADLRADRSGDGSHRLQLRFGAGALNVQPDLTRAQDNERDRERHQIIEYAEQQ